jgi:hypothetical protein
LKKIDNATYINLTDMARKFNERPEVPIQSWMKNASTLKFLELWERLNNPGFKHYQMVVIREELADNGRFREVESKKAPFMAKEFVVLRQIQWALPVG